jgi:hypothetical protein
MVVFLLHLKSCFRLTPFRREIAGAVIGENPVVGEKFRGAQESLRGQEVYKSRKNSLL